MGLFDFLGGDDEPVTKTSGVAPEYKPQLEKIFAESGALYDARTAAGPEATVAQLAPQQLAALTAQEGLARDAISGTGIYDYGAEIDRMLQDASGGNMTAANAANTFGSARSDLARQGALAKMALPLAQARAESARAGVESLGGAGTVLQTQAQRNIDAPLSNLQILQAPMGIAPQTTTQTGGEGK